MPWRNGQWTSFDDQGRFDGVFRTRSGKAVGIYHEDGTIHLVKPDGTNLYINVNGEIINVALNIVSADLVHSLEWISDRRDIPFERIKHLPENWQPTP